MLFLGLLALGTALALPIAALGATLGQGRAAAAALEGIARQPEAAGKIQTAMILGLAFMEVAVLLALVSFFILSGKFPAIDAAQAVQMATAASSGVGQ